MRRKANKLERVERLHNSLPSASMKQITWMIAQARREGDNADYKGSYNHYCCIVTTKAEWQVCRFFLIRCERGKRIGFRFVDLTEVSQRWMKEREDGSLDLEIFEKQKAMYWYNRSFPWKLSAPLSLKSYRLDYTRGGRDLFSCYDEDIYPTRRFLKSFEENGLAKIMGREDNLSMLMNGTKEYIDRYPSLDLDHSKVAKVKKGEALSLLNPMCETLIKMGEDELAKTFIFGGNEWMRARIGRYWKSFLVAHRHGFRPTRGVDWFNWFDYIADVDTAGLDTHSPKYCCPTDLDKAHETVTAILMKQRERAEAKRKEDELAEIAKKEKQFLDDRAMYFGLHFEEKGITIDPLKSVREFYEEGEAMHHCVYRCNYYTNQSALILSARDLEGHRLETIEVNLNTFDIAQSRGVCNKPSERHTDIVNIMRRNMDAIRKVAC